MIQVSLDFSEHSVLAINLLSFSDPMKLRTLRVFREILGVDFLDDFEFGMIFVLLGCNCSSAILDGLSNMEENQNVL